MSTFNIDLPLPVGYRHADLLAFHGRDGEGVAEQTSPQSMRKGVLVDGVPVVIAVRLDDPAQARCTLECDGRLTSRATLQAGAALTGMLGLRIDPQLLADMTGDDPLVGPLLARRPGLRVMQSCSVFEALSWAIIGQQINLPFAIALRRSLILQAGRQHSSGLWCYPEAADAARLDPDRLTSQKFSRAKAETLVRLARLIDGGQLDLALPASGAVEAISEALLAIKGIGPWTVNYALLRGYGYADCSLHGDVALRAGLQKLLGETTKPEVARTEQFLALYRPQRTMLAAHLWASLADKPLST